MSSEELKAHVAGAVDGWIGKGVTLLLMTLIAAFCGWAGNSLTNHTGQLAEGNRHLVDIDHTIQEQSAQIAELRKAVEHQSNATSRLMQKVFGTGIPDP